MRSLAVVVLCAALLVSAVYAGPRRPKGPIRRPKEPSSSSSSSSSSSEEARQPPRGKVPALLNVATIQEVAAPSGADWNNQIPDEGDVNMDEVAAEDDGSDVDVLTPGDGAGKDTQPADDDQTFVVDVDRDDDASKYIEDTPSSDDDTANDDIDLPIRTRNLEETLEDAGFADTQLDALKNKGLTEESVLQLVEEGFQPDELLSLSNIGLQADEIESLNDLGAPVQDVITLHNAGISIDDIVSLSEAGIDSSQLQSLASRGYKPEGINVLMEKGWSTDDLGALLATDYPADVVLAGVKSGSAKADIIGH